MGGGGGDSYRPGGHHFFKEVWSPSGGWWCDPKGWRRNTAVAACVFLAAQYALFSYSAANERRYVAPKGWVASMSYTDAGRYPKAKGDDDDDEE